MCLNVFEITATCKIASNTVHIIAKQHFFHGTV